MHRVVRVALRFGSGWADGLHMLQLCAISPYPKSFAMSWRGQTQKIHLRIYKHSTVPALLLSYIMFLRLRNYYKLKGLVHNVFAVAKLL